MRWRFRKKQSTSRSRKYRDHHPLRLQILIGVMLTLLLVGTITGVWYGSRVEAWQITEIEVVGGATIAAERVRTIAAEELAGSYLHLVPKRFRYTYPQETITQKIQDLDRVKQVLVERSAEQTITIAFDEYIPAALWCSEDDVTDGTPCMFLDDTGYAFTQAPQLYGGAFVRYYHHAQDPAPTRRPFTTEYIQETQAFRQWLEETFDWYVTHIKKENEYDTTYTMAEGGMIKVSNTLERRTWQANLNTLLASAEMRTIREGEFHYIDLRFGDKVFVNEEVPSAASSTATSTASSTTTSADSRTATTTE